MQITYSALFIALTAGRGDARNEVGLAAIDLQYPYLILCQISDCQTYVNTLTKINVVDPIEILIPETMCEHRGRGNKLYRSIREKFHALNITPISRIHFNESTGMERVRTLCAREYSTVELIVKQKSTMNIGAAICFDRRYYALAAAAALLKYVEYIQHMVYAPKSMRIEFQGSPNTTMIDIESARSLELVVSQSKQSIVSLLGTMNRCLTPMGRRLLRASILQPSCDECLIAYRQSCVAELVANYSLCTSLQVVTCDLLRLTFRAVSVVCSYFIIRGKPVVQRLFGTDRLLMLAIKPLHVNDMQNAERNLNYALLLKSCLDTIPELEAILATGVHPFFVKTRKVCFLANIIMLSVRDSFTLITQPMVPCLQNLRNSEFQVMKDKILTLIHMDARFVKGCTSLSMQRCFAIKADINQLLDVARQIYCELISDMKNMVEQLAVKHKLPLSLEYSINLGYHINVVIPRGSNMTISDLPVEFIQARKNRRSITMTTTALLTLNKQCKNACEEIYMMSNTLLTNLLEDIRQHVGCLFQLSADVAELDLILSLAQISSNPEYVRPSFGAKLELINSLHPIMELFNRDLPVANDVNASITHNFHLITGPNMSGKSTYLKQIVLLQIMAQIGSYVPASKATFRVADRILCRISSRDDAELNASAYVLEMKEAQYILQSVTPKSLVILDELCRHTTVEEGSAIAWAICEKLSLTTAFTFAATHFLHLTALSNMYHNVTSHCFETKTAESEESNDLHLIYTHKLNPGRGPTDHYGIALAEVSSLPKCVTIKAREYASQQSVNIQNNNFRSITTSPSWEKSCYNAIVQLRALLENNRFTFANIISIMKQLDLSKQTKRAAQVQVKSPNVVQECREQEKCEEEKNLVVASNNNLTRTEDVVSLLLVPMNKDEQKVIENKVQDEPMEIIENDNRKADESIHDVILNQKALSLPETVNRSPSTANPDFSLLNDPRFYVCTSFTASTPKITLQFCEANLGSSFTANSSVAASPSFNASQSIEYHDYCLSEGEFDITLPSQSTPSDIAKMTARSKEAKIFRQIEGGDFNEDSFFNDTQTTLKLNLSMDNDDVMMLPM
ncbi:PREDICTED: LOW QUALITY PROTEIN: mutS protein homolog 4-like [Acromyrmex echinatior]|uniref:LOW QUALITY PROTEIN: mutS protein homolog 4-like n=1 Tax=Acromyrmex echinatior TaxID=103372 RepID=UPI000580D293|nr:PREDICTED: LOW QUALITY PROTEIN: mutS protein homolog 4-like [Acromyrmex echinatior]